MMRKQISPIKGSSYQLTLKLPAVRDSIFVHYDDISGKYEYISNRGRKYHLFSNDVGRDVFLTKAQFNQALRKEALILDHSNL